MENRESTVNVAKTIGKWIIGLMILSTVVGLFFIPNATEVVKQTDLSLYIEEMNRIIQDKNLTNVPSVKGENINDELVRINIEELNLFMQDSYKKGYTTRFVPLSPNKFIGFYMEKETGKVVFSPIGDDKDQILWKDTVPQVLTTILLTFGFLFMGYMMFKGIDKTAEEILKGVSG